ncbi:GTPase of the mitochondrial inner membrane that associates with the large ribosomal subunit [Nowakowskiella sp. JEL0407]|nr:GTPase of the mitochondrial inner membrane that associates with the large ribosomal subunit [Nowakowskiella sp. JEL0407]
MKLIFPEFRRCFSVCINVKQSALKDIPRLSLRRDTVLKKKSIQTERFLDYKRIGVLAGKGGDGAIAFRHDMRARGSRSLAPPNGGDGGLGGDVYIVGSKDVTTLSGLSTTYHAQNGGKGQAANKHGANGDDMLIFVPLGTVVRQIEKKDVSNDKDDEVEESVEAKVQEMDEADEEFEDDVEEEMTAEEDDEYLENIPVPESKTKEAIHEARVELAKRYFRFKEQFESNSSRIRDLLDRIPPPTKPRPPVDIDIMSDGEKHLIARGGRGGMGNPHFLNQSLRNPQIAGRGLPGEKLQLQLELKTIADSGLVGLPNAGKSSYLKAVSNAQPKIRNVPFTTLNPYVGTIDFPDFWTMTIADIPGIVRGAHGNIGLGHTFLRHIERSKVLIYVVDVSAEKPWEDWMVLRDELELYLSGLSSKPSIVIANKADVEGVTKEKLEEFTRVVESEVFKYQGEKAPRPIVVPVSALNGTNIKLSLDCIRAIVENI